MYGAYKNIRRFQSLIGFKINWNLITALGFTVTKGFQSLIGFKINWNFGELAIQRSGN
ncbi:unknown protein [Microcystis aeruginosa NIES-298]|nr:unknown protein [Microcystis aeruginosa NIES-298]